MKRATLRKRLPSILSRFFSRVLLVLCILTMLIVAVHATAITSFSPTSGPPGTTVTLGGSINTPDGNFSVYFDSTKVHSGTSTGMFSVYPSYGAVTAMFTVPNDALPGTHNVTLVDETDHSTSSPFPFIVVQRVLSSTTVTSTTTSTSTQMSTTRILSFRTIVSSVGVISVSTISCTNTTTINPELPPIQGALYLGTGAGVVLVIMTAYVLGKNSIIRGLEEVVRRYEEASRSLPQTRPESEPKSQPKFDSVDVQVRTGVQRLKEES